MKTSRLEAFSDGVIAIIITIMVLEMKVPHGAGLSALAPLWPVFLSYALSFVYIGLYWNNHHHMFQLTESINGGVLWANLHLLFWLSLLPFATGWMGENHFERWPTVLYGLNLLCCAIAYYLLQTVIVRHQGPQSQLATALGRDLKGKISPVLYIAGILGAWLVSAWVGLGFFVFVALMWLVPDRRLENRIAALSRRSGRSGTDSV
ncbi:TMEM175 family protein [Polaromonas sp.]|uniref:TMEM175 family protein n=1 Tax=Polaromonas sp. TaxID=1869339 RepID=UPI00286C3C7F|nr:TMEM175 family protein [Polaromonas sp.]